jgi:hypothetical protein
VSREAFLPTFVAGRQKWVAEGIEKYKKIPLGFADTPFKKGDKYYYPNTHSQSTISANSVSSSTHSNIIIHLLKYVFPSFQQTKSSQAERHDS